MQDNKGNSNVQSSKFQMVLSEEKENTDWDNFLANSYNGHHEQTSLWAQVKEHYGWKPIRIIVYQNGTIVAGVQILHRKLRFFGSVGYAAKGPCIQHNQSELIAPIIDEIKKIAISKKMVYLVIDLPYYTERYVPLFLSSGFQQHPQFLPPTSLMTATLILNLQNKIENILGDMKKKTRHNIRYGIKNGITVREGGESDIRNFFHFMVSTAMRQGETPSPADELFFHRVWELFEPKGWVKLFVTEYNNEKITIIFVFPFGTSVRAWRIGWSGQYAKLYPNNVCWWELIVWAKNNGYHFLDFIQVDPYIADIIKKKMPIPEDIKHRRFFGPTKFKLGYGGEVIQTPGAYSYFCNPLIRAAFNSFGTTLLRSTKMTGYANRIIKLASRFNDVIL